MAKRVGMNKTIKREWLDKTVELVCNGLSDAEIRKELKEYLSFEIDSPTTIKNSRTILLQTWVYIPDELQDIRAAALDIAKKRDYTSIVAHWCMMLLAYPILVDIATYVGKMLNIQDVFTVAWLKNKLNEHWGERTTILESVSKILLTLKNLEVVKSDKLGTYTISNKEIVDYKSICLIVKTILALKQKAYYEIAELNSIPLMFPFKYNVSHELLHNSELFTLNNFGGKVVVVGE